MNVKVVVECGHELTFKSPEWAPKMYERIWCVRHEMYERVIEAPHSYRVSCRGCSYGRGPWRMRATADAAAEKHHNRRPHHKIAIFDGYLLLQLIQPEKREKDKNYAGLLDAIEREHPELVNDLIERMFIRPD